MRAHAAQSARVQSLATAMRLTQQATWTAQRGGTAMANVTTGPKPWDI